jgi:Ca2+-binding RTX toxin-like protein
MSDKMDGQRHLVVHPRQCSRNRCLAGWTVPIHHRGRGGAAGRGNSNKDLVTGPIRDFCALQVIVDLTAGTATGEGTDTLTGIGQVFGSKHDDTISGDANPNTLLGGPGNDTISGAAGDDTLNGMDGTDTLDGGDGTDTCANGETNTNCEA